jgi:hypothetical protein
MLSPDHESPSRPAAEGTSWILTTAMLDRCRIDRRTSTFGAFKRHLRRSRRLRAARRTGWLVAALGPATCAIAVEHGRSR